MMVLLSVAANGNRLQAERPHFRGIRL